MKKKLLIFASGTKDGGGSGAKNLVLAQRSGLMKSADIVGFVSNHPNGGVARHAGDLGIPFTYFKKPRTGADYRQLVQDTGAEYVALSGWMLLTEGLDPKTTMNIHPGPLTMYGRPDHFGGPGMHGDHVHEAVLSAFVQDEVKHSAVCMHFVTENYDEGPVFLRVPVPIKDEDNLESLRARVNMAEHIVQPAFTELVLRGDISWDGKNPETLKGFYGYEYN